jgi:hypothetical protein
VNERLRCEFFLVRYVPDPVKNEFVNIGVLLREASRPLEAAVRFTRDWARVRCVDPDADIGMLEGLETEMRRRLAGEPAEAKPLLEIMEDSFSQLVQITAPKAYLTETLAAGMDELMRLYVEPRQQKARQAISGRQAIVRSMRAHFERAGVWDLMRRRIAASDYTRAGDPLKIDCGYRPNGMVRLFHGVSLAGDVELARVLAFTAPLLRAGIARVEGAELELTAVVEPLRDSNGDMAADGDHVLQYRFGVETMEAQQIRVLTVNDLERVAETAKRELRV